jgi:hypothetical protein
MYNWSGRARLQQDEWDKKRYPIALRFLLGQKKAWLTACPAESEHLKRKSTTSKSSKDYKNSV